jgi:hypothetical protein
MSASHQTTLSREASTAQPICLFPVTAELGLIDKEELQAYDRNDSHLLGGRHRSIERNIRDWTGLFWSVREELVSSSRPVWLRIFRPTV